jgi:PadR family transcriptional regulator, regulatory protein PadR
MGNPSRVEQALLRGAGPTAVLALLAEGEMYGYQLAQALDARSSGTLEMGHSTLYPLLYNLESKGLITSEERLADSGRVRRYYRLTSEGRRTLKRQRAEWRSLARALTQLGVLDPVPS